MSGKASVHIGCCQGSADPDGCGLNVTVRWKKVLPVKRVQRIHLFASVDCISWWQTGFAHPISRDNIGASSSIPHNESAGGLRITDGCFGEGFRQTILAACLTTDPSFTGKHFEKGSPFRRCKSVFGVCQNVGEVFVSSELIVMNNSPHTTY